MTKEKDLEPEEGTEPQSIPPEPANLPDPPGDTPLIYKDRAMASPLSKDPGREVGLEAELEKFLAAGDLSAEAAEKLRDLLRKKRLL